MRNQTYETLLITTDIKKFLPLRAVLLLITWTLVLGLSAAHAQMRLAVPSYQNPGTATWSEWAAPGPGAVGLMVFDIGNGDNLTYDPTVAAAIQSTRAQGIKVLGYTYTEYGARDPQLVTQAIDGLYNNYLVDGVFFDQAPVNCTDANTYASTQFLYYQALTNYVRQKQIGTGITVLNPGTYVPTDCWMSITNILVNWENEGGFSLYQTEYVDYPWVHQYSPDRFWHIVLGVTQSQMQTALNLVESRNAGWVYLSDSSDNAYNQIPVYWSAEATAVMQEGVPGLIPQTGWSVRYVDSQETSCYNGAAANAIDGDLGTIWHTQFCGEAPATPHEIQISLGGSYSLTGFQYLPRQDGSACGWINQYEFYVSTDGINWGTPVASGNFNYGNLSTQCPGPGAGVPGPQQISFPATTGQFIRLRALSEINGNPWTSSAEIGVLGSFVGAGSVALTGVSLNPAIVVGGSPSTGTITLNSPAPSGGAVVALSSNNAVATVPPSVTVPAGGSTTTFPVTTIAVATSTPVTIEGSYNGNQMAALTVNPISIPQAAWSVIYVDSQETSCYNGAATNAIDGNSSTMWHTQYCGAAPATPHEIRINLGAAYNLSAFQYLPRQDGSACGWINQYEFYVSTDGVNWGTAVASGNFNYGSLSTQCPGPGAGVPGPQQVAFPPTTAQFIRLRALSEINGNPWTSAAEIDVLGNFASTGSLALTSVSLNPAIVVGGSPTTGTVTLNGPAPSGGAVVTLSSNSAAAAVPPSVTVSAGSNTATFAIVTDTVTFPTLVSIGGNYNGNQSAGLTVNPGTVIAKADWSILFVDSQETSCYNGAATNAVDENSTTLWHTQFCGASPATPHEIQINLGASYGLTAFQYLPRQDGSACGWIKQYEFYVSTDGVNWGTAVATGTFNYGGLIAQCPGPGAGVPPALQIAFPETTGQYVRLRALSEINNNPWTSAAEIDVLGVATRQPVLSSVSLNPPSIVGGGVSTGAVTLDGPAPPGGALVTLSSDNTLVAAVPASVTVAEGNNSATFAVTTSSVAASTPVSIGASYNGTQSATLTVGSGALTGSFFYVSTAGSDANPGTAAAPWRTIQHAANSVQAGATVYVLAGVYNEAVKMAASGSAAAGPITLQSYPGETAVVDGTGLAPGSGNSGLFSITNQSYITIQGFDIRNYQTSSASATPAGIWVSGSGSNIQILNNSVHDIVTTSEATGNAFGIAVYGTAAPASLDSVIISGNQVYRLKTGSSESLAVDGNVTNFSITNNLIHDNDNIGIDAIGYEGVAPNAAYDYARNGEISGNTVYNISAINNPGEGSQYAAAGIYCDGCSQVIIERNRVYNSDLNIEVGSEHLGYVSSYVTVRSNLVYNANSVGISIGGYASTVGGTDHCTIINNTLLQNDTQKTGSGEFQVQYYATNNVFENNIVYASSQGLLINNLTSSEPSPVSLNYNLYYSPLAAASAGFVWNGTKYQGLATYQSATAQDANSPYANPLFLSLTIPNLQVPAASPAVNAGTNLGTAVEGTLDFAGNARVQGNNIDIGAYEQ